jgi:hypothetical protein
MRKFALISCTVLALAGTPVLAADGIPPPPPSPPPPSASDVHCEMSFTLSGWSVFYKKYKGSGLVMCNNGQSMKVALKSEGGGLTAGKSTIDDGHGDFTGVHDIKDVLGDYATGGAHAGAGKSASASGLTKGDVSLSMTGKGRGVDLGVDFGKFTIAPEGTKLD